MILSIIVPVYNVEKYLAKCIDSLLQQDLAPESYEIILVNDGSTDGSENIAKQYEATYKHIKLILQPNGGLSAARNTGIRQANGKYIQFVDSDDYLEPNVLGALVQKMEQEQLDVLRFNYQNVNEQYHVFTPYKAMKPFVDYRDEVCDGLTFLTERLGYGCYAVQFMIRATLLQAEVHHFKAGIYFEDTEWTPRLLVRAQRVTSVDTMVYNYLMRTGSITQSVDPEKTKKLLNDKLLLIDSMKQQAEQQPDKRWFGGMIAATVISLLGYVGADFYPHRAFYFKALREKSIYPLSMYHSAKGAKRKIRVINLSPAVFCWLLHVKHKTHVKVAFLLGSLNRGGTETLVLDVFKKASQAPFQVVGIHRKGGAYLPDFKATGEKMIALAPRFVGDVSYFVKLRRLLQREHVGVVHAQQCLDAVYARIACVGTGIKVVQTFHGYDFNAGKLMRRFMRFSAHCVDANFFVSASQRDYYIKSYQLKDHYKQHVVYNGVNFDKLDQQVAQVELPVGGDPASQGLKLAMVGNFVRVREQNTVCQFLKLLKEAGVPFDFYFVGRKSESEPWLYDDCVAYCQEHQLLDCVHFLGGRGDVPAILKQLDAFIYSTNHDTFGIAIIEAIASGIPTFVNDWEVMKEITNNGKWATIYKTKNAVDLFKKFTTFVNNKEYYKQQACSHAQEVRSTYSIEQHMLALSNLYNTLNV